MRSLPLASPPPLSRRLAAESVGSFFLFATVIGSGIMAQHLSQSNDAIALLGNTLATAAMLFVLITMLGPISGAHMNPAVSLVSGLMPALTS
jgi:glycerol uptake facilitator-like aquaporin